MLISISKMKCRFSLEQLFVVFVIFDICLFPYIRPLRSLSSMLLLLVWFAFKILGKCRSFGWKKIKLRDVDKEVLAFIATCVCILVSLIAGMLTLPATVPSSYQSGPVNVLSRTVTYSAIYIYTLLFYFFFKEMVPKHKQLVYKVLKIIFTVVFLFAVIYLISPAFFYKIRAVWTISGTVHNATVGASSYYRYTFSVSDPNNAAAITVAIAVLIIENKDERTFTKCIAFIQCAFILLATMSVQGVLGLAAYVVVKMVYFAAKVFTGSVKIDKRVFYVVTGVACIILVMMPFLVNIPIISKAIHRLTSNGGSFLTRWNLWVSLLQEKGIWDYLLWGQGCAILREGIEVLPHNGHLHLLYSYGFVAYLLFLYVFFRKREWTRWKDMMFAIPLFVCFTINVGLLDARYSFLMAVITAYGFMHLKQQKI